MDTQTQQYYTRNAPKLSNLYNGVTDGVSRYFQQAFSTCGKILDIGCGSGRDLNILHEIGFAADGVDPCPEFVELCNKNISGYGTVIKQDSLPELKEISDKRYDGVLCSAVLMHLPKEHLFDASFTIRRILRENGRFLMSVPLEDKTIGTDNRDSNKRFFNGITPEHYQLIFERIGFTLINRWDSDDSLGRDYRKWATLLFVLRDSKEIRPLDTIESVLNRDKKTATYKLALFRALAEIAITNHNLAKWVPGGKVKIPVVNISEKWIEYYWPLLEADIKQTTFSSPAFKNSMEALINCYKDNKGGLTRFIIEYKSNTIQTASKITNKLINDLSSTIVKNPIKYAGGENFSIFDYDKTDKCVIMSADIWRELSLTGSWIADATILRWAELTARMSKGTTISAVIECLLTAPIPERETSMATKLYDSILSKHCVWSDKTIENKYDIDHAIPFSLWKNNDLWNLFPADKKINNEKRDKLPTKELIKKREDCLVGYWRQSRDKFKLCFDYEVSKFIGRDIENLNGGWENILFANFAEAIEITAIQRGVERWQPENCATLIISNEEKTTVPLFAKVLLPFFSDLKIACGTLSADSFQTDFACETIEIDNIHGNLDPNRHFVLRADGNSMNAGNAPIKDGDLLLLEKNEGGTISNQIMAVEYQDETGGTSYALKRITKDGKGKYRLVSVNKDYEDIIVTENMRPLARLKENLGKTVDKFAG
jgi:SAM-dependent methyltransferase